jgi:hypothetical protein
MCLPKRHRTGQHGAIEWRFNARFGEFVFDLLQRFLRAFQRILRERQSILRDLRISPDVVEDFLRHEPALKQRFVAFEFALSPFDLQHRSFDL